MSGESKISLDDWRKKSLWLGRDKAPELLYDTWFATGFDTPETEAYAVCDAWTMAEHPEWIFDDPETWVEMFEQIGFTIDGKRSDRPSAPLDLYRGGTTEYGMSWTSDYAVAERFATGGIRGRAQGQVWTRTFEPDDLLAYISERQEFEYIVNPSLLA